LTLLDVIFFFLISTEACINSYAGVLRGRSPDSMSGTGMSSILSLEFFFALILRTRDTYFSFRAFLSLSLSLYVYACVRVSYYQRSRIFNLCVHAAKGRMRAALSVPLSRPTFSR